MANNESKVIISAVDKTREGFESAKRGAQGLESSFNTLNGTVAKLAPLLGAATFTALIKGAIDTADSFNDLSKKTGIAVDQIGAWKLAADQSGTSIEAVAKGIKGLSTNMVENGDKLKSIGITAKTTNEAFIQAAGIISKLPVDSPKRLAAAVKIFGKAGQDLLPMLSEGEAGLRKMLEQGQRFNKITPEMAAQADAFNDNLATLQMSASQLGFSMAGQLLPSLTDITSAMTEAAKEGGILKAIWVGLGGSMAQLLGIDDRSQMQKRLESVNKEIAITTAAIAKGEIQTINGPVKVAGDVLQDYLKKLRDLGKESQSLNEYFNPKTAPAAPDKPNKALNSFLAGPNTEAEKLATQYKTLIDSSRQYVVGMRYENIEGEKLSDGQKKLNDLREFLLANSSKLSQSQMLAIGQTMQQVAVEDNLNQSLDDRRERVAAMVEVWQQENLESKAHTAGLVDSRNAYLADVAAANDQIKTLDSQIAMLKQGATANAASEAARLRETAAIFEQNAADAEQNNVSAENVKSMRDRADALRTLADAQETIASRQTELKSLNDQVDMWKTIDRTAHDTWVSIFDSGKPVLTRLTDMLKNGILDGLYQITAKPWIISLSGAVSGSAASNAFAAGETGDMPNIGGLSQNNLLGSLGNLIGGGFGSGLSFASNAGVLEGFKAGFSTLLSGGLGGEGMLSSFGAMAPGLGIGLTAISLASSLFSGHVSRPKYYANTGIGTNGKTSLINAYGNSDASGDGGGVAINAGSSMGSAIKKYTDALQGEIIKGFTIGTHYSAKYQQYGFSIGSSINKNGTNRDFTVAGDGSQTTAGAALGFITAVKKGFVDLPDYLEKIIKRSNIVITNAVGSANNISTLKQMYEALQSLPPVFDTIRESIDKTVKTNNTKQLKTLFDAIGVYVADFYTDAEKNSYTQKSLQQQFAKLNLTLPSTKEGFRALVDGLASATDDASKKQYEALIKLAPAVKEYFDTFTALSDELAAKANALNPDIFSNLFDFNDAKARLAAGLSVKVPSYDVGTSYVPADGLAMIHKGERIIPAADNAALMANMKGSSGGGNQSQILSQIATLLNNLITANSAENIGINNKLISISADIKQLNNDGVIVRDVDIEGNQQIVKVQVVA